MKSPSFHHCLTVLILLALLGLGLGLRLYRIDIESVDLEEYITLGYFDQPDLVSYLNYVHEKYKVSTPLSFLLQYLWLDSVGYGHTKARLLCVFFGMATLLLLYVFCVEFFGKDGVARRAGLFAVFCAALSPVYIFYSQEARQYPLYAFTALLAAYALLRALREHKGRWWGINFLANTALIATHPFGVFFLLAEGIAILFLLGRRIKPILCWGGSHSLILVPLIYWIKDMPKSAETVLGLTKEFSLGESAILLFHDLFSDDLIHYAAQLGPVDRIWPWLPAEWYWPLKNLHPWFDAPLAGFFVLASLWALWRAFSRKGDPAGAPKPREYTLLLCWMIVPPLALGLISWLKMPVNMTRYSLYATLGLYCIAGGFWASIPSRFVRLVIALLLAGLYAYQNTFLLPGPMRTEWREIARYIEVNGKPADPIFFHGPLYLPIFQINAPELSNPATPTMNRETSLCDMAEFYFHNYSCAEEEAGKAAWVVLFEQQGPGDALEACLQAQDIEIEGPVLFRGARRILLYRLLATRLASPPARNPAALEVLKALAQSIRVNQQNPHWRQFLNAIYYDSDTSGAPYIKLAASLARRGDLDFAAHCLYEAMLVRPGWLAQLYDHELRFLADWDIPRAEDMLAQKVAQGGQVDALLHLLYAEAALFNNKPELALAQVNPVLAQDPRNPVALFTLWRCYTYEENPALARQSLEALMECDPALNIALRPLYEALYITKDPEAIQQALDATRAAGMPLSIPLVQALQRP